MFRLREVLGDRGVMQKELAAELDLPQQTMSNYVTGKRQADYDTLVRICNVLGITMDYLFGRSSSPTPAVSDEDAEVLRAYHALTPEIRKIVDQALEPYRKESKADQAS